MARLSATVSRPADQRVQARTRAGGARQNVRSGVPRRPYSPAARTHIAAGLCAFSLTSFITQRDASSRATRLRPRDFLEVGPRVPSSRGSQVGSHHRPAWGHIRPTVAFDFYSSTRYLAHSEPHRPTAGISFASRGDPFGPNRKQAPRRGVGRANVRSDQLNSRSITSAPRRSSGTITFR
jgi:hypothetical protein